jgi:hypothetical protein
LAIGGEKANGTLLGERKKILPFFQGIYRSGTVRPA